MSTLGGAVQYVLLISFLIIILAVIGITLLSSRFIILKMNTNQFLLRTSPFVTIIAGALLMIFKNKKERTNKIINKIAGLSYGIYLIHDNTNFSYFLWYKLLKVPLYVKTNLLIPHMFISCLLVYLACGLIEFLREFLHEKLLAKRLYNLSIKIETKFKKLKFIN